MSKERVEGSEEKVEEQVIEEKTEVIKPAFKRNVLGIPIPQNRASACMQHLDSYLENEKVVNQGEPWCKLNKTDKIRLFQEFVLKRDDLTELEQDQMLEFLKDCINKKKLQRVKDVVYNKTEGYIVDIPSLNYVKATRHFTLKNMDKRPSTLKSLGTKKNTLKKADTDVDSDVEEN